MNGFLESLGANAILLGGFVLYKLVRRCLYSKCRVKDGTLDFDLGEPEDCPANDMAAIAELIKKRSEHHLAIKKNNI